MPRGGLPSGYNAFVAALRRENVHCGIVKKPLSLIALASGIKGGQHDNDCNGRRRCGRGVMWLSSSSRICCYSSLTSHCYVCCSQRFDCSHLRWVDCCSGCWFSGRLAAGLCGGHSALPFCASQEAYSRDANGNWPQNTSSTRRVARSVTCVVGAS